MQSHLKFEIGVTTLTHNHVIWILIQFIFHNFEVAVKYYRKFIDSNLALYIFAYGTDKTLIYESVFATWHTSLQTIWLTFFVRVAIIDAPIYFVI